MTDIQPPVTFDNDIVSKATNTLYCGRPFEADSFVNYDHQLYAASYCFVQTLNFILNF